jgi:predicted nucleic acid-binding protein
MQKRNKEVVVCNSSPIINLCNTGLTSLISKLYKNIIIPNAVYNECAQKLKIIPSALPYLEKAIERGFWINEKLYMQIKAQIKNLY